MLLTLKCEGTAAMMRPVSNMAIGQTSQRGRAASEQASHRVANFVERIDGPRGHPALGPGDPAGAARTRISVGYPALDSIIL